MERWKDIKNYEGYYQVSNFGTVKSLDRKEIISSGVLRTYKSKTLIAQEDGRGYLMVRLYKNGKGTTKRIHRLVAETFIENINGLEEINHIDGNKENNSTDNLEWSTRKENINHAIGIGLFKNNGAHNTNSKLTFEEADEIRVRYLTENITQTELADEYSVDRSQISLIVNYKAYCREHKQLEGFKFSGQLIE